MNILYFVRHGETSWNKSKIYQGSTDIPLNSTGLQQAKLVSSYFKDISIDDIFTSPSKLTPLKNASTNFEISIHTSDYADSTKRILTIICSERFIIK